MKTFNLSVPEENAKEFAKEMIYLTQKYDVTVENKKELNSLIPITERVQTFNDAVKELGEAHPHVRAYHSYFDSPENDRDLLAYLKLRIIVSALNEGWKPKFVEGEYRYAPWFKLYTQEEIDNLIKTGCKRVLICNNSCANAYAGIAYSDTNFALCTSDISIGGNLCFKTKELAEYAGQTFLDLWANMMLF